MATIDELRARAELIAEEQQIGGNTAERVGDAFDMVADIIEAVAPGDQQAVLYNPQSPNEAQKAQARANIGAQETISDIADFVKVSAQTFTAEQKQQARENIGAEQAGGAVKNLAGSASDTETLIKAANNPNLQSNVHLSGNNIYVNGIAGGIDLDNNGVNIKAGNSGYPNAKVKVNGQEVATKLYVDGKIDDRADPIELALDLIEAVIPSQASAQNQLADKAFVNSSISSSTANFVGTFDSLAGLQAVQNPTNNDYGFVIETDAVGNEYYDRYKYNGSSWLFEYKVESTPFTAAQWAAIQSGITSELVGKLSALPTNAALTTSLNAKADKSDTYTKAEVNNLIVPSSTTIQVVETLPPTGSANTVYRVPGTDSYTDYGWDGTQFVPLATYDGDLNNAVMVTPQVFTERQKGTALENLGLEQGAGALKTLEDEDGFYITDAQGNVGAQVVDGKIDALGLGDNLSEIVEDVASEAVKAAAVHSETKENGFYITDAQGNVGAEVVDGKIDALDLGDNLKEIVGALFSSSMPKGTIQNLAESFVAAHAELTRMRDEVSRMSESMLSIKNAGGHNYTGTITIPMSQAQEDLAHGVFRIGLHYGNHLGSNIWHEVFFGGNVNKDFTDVRIKDASGKILPTRLLHSGNYEVVQDYRLRGSDDSMRYYDGAFYWTDGVKIYVTNDDFETSTELSGQTVRASNFYFDNFGGLWFNDTNTNKVYYCRRVNGGYDFSSQVEITDLTVTNGETNSDIRIQDLVQDAQGYVYFGTYQTNFNVVIFKTTNPVTAQGITADGSGNYVFECYNQPRVYKNGQIDPDYCDQHVHHMDMFYAVDGNGNQVCNIIAGLDNSNTEKGPNIISSIDGGQTWVSFRDTIDTIDWVKYKGHDYSFSWMSSDNSFTILGGENNVLGGPALGKMYTKVDVYGRIIPTEVTYTWDGLTGMRRVTSDGDDWIMLPLVACYQNNYNSIVVSEDGAKTWHSIYTEYKRANQGVGHGVRKLSNLVLVTNPADPTPCWYGRGYNMAEGNMPPIRVYKGGEHYYGELLVDVGKCEAGTDIVLTVESGYMAAAPDAMVFERAAANAAGTVAPVWELPLQEGCGDVVRDSNGVVHAINGGYEWGSPDSTMYFWNSVPRIKGYKEGGGLRLEEGAYIDLGHIPQLKFNKGFSVVVWLSLNASKWTENYYQLWPIIGCADFVVGRTLNGFYVGGKANGTFSRGLVSIPNVRGVFIPMMITVSADTIPVVTGYIGENDGVVQNVVVASTWPSVLLSTLNLRVGSPEVDTETTYGGLNKDCYMQGLAIYDRVLTQDEFRTLINGRSITSDYDIITK